MTGKADAAETAIGYVLKSDAIDANRLNIDKYTMDRLLTVDPDKRSVDIPGIGKHDAQFDNKLPATRVDESELPRKISRCVV